MPCTDNWIATLVKIGVELLSKALGYGSFAILPNWVQQINFTYVPKN